MRIGRRGTLVDLMLSPAFMMLVGLGIILVFLLGKISAIGDDTAFQKKFLANDFALVLDAVPAAQGDVDLYFGPHKPEFGNAPSNFSYSITGHTVKVFEGEKDDDAGQATFADAETAKVQDSILQPEQGTSVLPRIIKAGHTVEITKSGSKRNPNLMHLDCPLAQVDLGRIVVDAGHGFSPKGGETSDAGFVSGNVREHILTRMIAKGIVDRAAQQKRDVLVTRTVSPPPTQGEQAGEEELLSMAERLQRAAKGDTVVSVHIGSAPQGMHPVIAYVLADSAQYAASYKLACEAVNAIADKIPLTQAAVVPVLSDRLPDPAFSVLGVSKAGVAFEIGNINDSAIVDQTAKIAEAIWEGVNHAQR